MSGFPITPALMKRMWPTCPAAYRDGVMSALERVCSLYGINTRLRLVHFMAQISHECGAGTDVVESLYYTSAARISAIWPSRFTVASAQGYVRNPKKLANRVYNGRMGNRKDSDDGFNYRGRGPLQNTGREAYAKLQKGIDQPLLKNPDLLADPVIGTLAAGWEFQQSGCLPWCDKDDITRVTRIVNGGTIGLADRKAWLAKWKKVIPTWETSAPVAFADIPEDADEGEEKSSAHLAEVDEGEGAEVYPLEAVQKRLRDLGYFDVGTPDGNDASGMTTAAVARFCKVNNIPYTVSDAIPPAIRAAIMADGAIPAPVSLARANATAADLKGKVPGVDAGGFQKKGGLLAGAGAIFWSAIDWFQDQFQTIWGYFQPVYHWLAAWPKITWVIAFLAIAWWVWKRGQAAQDEAVQAFREGKVRT